MTSPHQTLEQPESRLNELVRRHATVGPLPDKELVGDFLSIAVGPEKAGKIQDAVLERIQSNPALQAKFEHYKQTLTKVAAAHTQILDILAPHQ